VFRPGGQDDFDPPVYVVEAQGLARWRTNCLALLAQVISQGHVLWSVAENIKSLESKREPIEKALAELVGVRESFERGFLDDLVVKIESEIAADYMGQAENLLRTGLHGKYDHVPAAVLAGAVLERALRMLCQQQEPPIAGETAAGNPKTMNLLTEDLKKAGLYNELKAKQLRAWAGIRNHAAHGEFDQFKATDVEQMIQGINSFLGDYLK
jgi:hypothetical protein